MSKYSFHHHEALMINALRDVINGEDEEYQLRKIFRWYSGAFCTPLHEVDALPLEDVLQAFYETEFEKMDENRRETQVRDLLETPEKRKERIMKEEAEWADADDFAAVVSEEVVKTKKLEEIVVPKESEIAVIGLKELPPEVKIEFVDAETFDLEAEHGSNDPGDNL